MEYKDYASMCFSVIALAVSCISLWWSSFRRRIAFYFMQTGPWHYALVNGGKTDILVTEVRYWFVGSNPRAAVAPAQTSAIAQEGALLLKAGTASQHKVTITEPISLLFNEPLAMQATGSLNAKEFTVKIAVWWIDMDGNQNQAEIVAGIVTLTVDKFVAWVPLNSRKVLAPVPTPNLISRLRQLFKSIE